MIFDRQGLKSAAGKKIYGIVLCPDQQAPGIGLRGDFFHALQQQAANTFTMPGRIHIEAVKN